LAGILLKYYIVFDKLFQTGKKKKMTTAYSYIRLSSKEQIKGHGSLRQTKAIKEAAQRYHWNLSEQTFSDLGVSSFKGLNRLSGALGQFIKLAQTGQIEKGSVLIVENVDRLSRENVTKSVSLMFNLINLGINIYTLSDDRIYKEGSPTALMDLMLWALSAQRAHEESVMKSKRIRASRENAKQRAREAGVVMNRSLPAWLKWSDDRTELIVKDEIATVIQRIFKLYADGLSMKPIAMRLNAEDIEYWGRTKKWSHSTVKNLIKNINVTGTMQPLKLEDGKCIPEGLPIENYYPRIVEQDVWQTTVNLRNAKTNSRGRHSADKETHNLFRGLLKCTCGTGFSLNNSTVKGKRYSSLRCTALKSNGCKAKTWNYKPFETIVLLALQDLDWSSIIGINEAQSDVKQNELNRRLENLQLTIDSNHNKINNLSSAIADGLNSSTVMNNLMQLEADQEKLEAEKDAVIRELNSLKQSQSNLDDNIEQLQELFSMLSNGDDVRHKINQRLNQELDKIVVGESDDYITFNKLGGAYKDEELTIPVLPEGKDSIKGSIALVFKSGASIHIDVLKNYKRAFSWQDGLYTEYVLG